MPSGVMSRSTLMVLSGLSSLNIPSGLCVVSGLSVLSCLIGQMGLSDLVGLNG